MNLTKKLRDEVIQNILAERFQKEEDTLVTQFSKSVIAKYRDADPTFYEIFDKYGVNHLRYTTTHRLRYSNGARAALLTESKDITVGGVFPCNVWVYLSPEQAALWDALSDQYSKAKNTLKDIFNGYKTVEKLCTDFPEFKKHFPASIDKMQLPSVVVSEVRTQLTEAGII
jgi:hypothetical protein